MVQSNQYFLLFYPVNRDTIVIYNRQKFLKLRYLILAFPEHTKIDFPSLTLINKRLLQQRKTDYRLKLEEKKIG